MLRYIQYATAPKINKPMMTLSETAKAALMPML